METSGRAVAESGNAGVGKKPPPILGIFLTVFLDLLSFGLFIPDLQLRGQELARSFLGPHASILQIEIYTGFSLAIFSLAQLLTSPFLGRLSDRIGRRKILILTCLLSTVAYGIYASADSYPMILLARLISGIAAANLGVAFAYVADITKPEDRAQGLGKVGAAFGLGFIFGPPTGVWLLQLGHGGPQVLGYTGAFLSFVNFLYVLFFLPESVTEARTDRKSFFSDFKTAFQTPGLGLMLLMYFAVNFGFTNLESTFFQLLRDPRAVFHLPLGEAKRDGGFLLAYVGIMAAIMQGLVVRKVIDRYGELKVLRYAYLGYVPTIGLIPFIPLWLPFMLGQTLLGICSGLAQPSLNGLISKSAPKTIQGGVFGVTQALGALARVLGPLVSNPLLAIKPSYPYALGAFIIMIPATLAWRLKEPAAVEPGA